MMRWRPAAPFQTAHAYAPGQEPKDFHPTSWGPLELHRFAELPGGLKVVVHSTARRHDGWSFNVAELERYPGWISYFHNLKSGTRIQSHRSANEIAGQLAQAFELHEWA